jgi:hypothetical protein
LKAKVDAAFEEALAAAEQALPMIPAGRRSDPKTIERYATWWY